MNAQEIDEQAIRDIGKKAKQGVIVWLVISFFLNIYLKHYFGDSLRRFQSAGFGGLFLNYAISAWYIKKQILKGSISRPFLFGLKVSFFISVIALLLFSVLLGLLLSFYPEFIGLL